MPKYIPQETFDYGALVLASAIYLKHDPLQIARKLADEYRTTYADTELESEWLSAAQAVIKAMPEIFSQQGMDDAKFANAWTTIAHAIERFEPSGKKKGKWFRGAMFSGEKSPIPNKAQKTAVIALISHHAIMNGQIPLKDLK